MLFGEGSSFKSPNTQEPIFNMLRHFNEELPQAKTMEEAFAFSCYDTLLVGALNTLMLSTPISRF